MDAKVFYLKLDEIIEQDPGTITGEESLTDEGIFDSLAMLGLIAFLDEGCGVEMTPEDIMALATVKSLHEKVCKSP